MIPKFQHRWDLTPQEALALQQQWRAYVIREDAFGEIRHVAGLDVSYDARHKIAQAVISVLCYPDLNPKTSAYAERKVTFPYVPGLLSFREIPPLLDCFEKLDLIPDLLLCDGHGIAHPRRFGLACHLAILLDLPSIGIAKRRLIGEHAPVQQERGAWQPLCDGDEMIGAALRTKPQAKPVFISIGHRVSLETALRIVLECTPQYRLPETTRWAHHLCKSPER